MSEHKIKFVYEHGSADQSRLDLYDGSVSLNGIARAMTIATHALINKEIRTRADRAQGAEFYLLPSRRGSFEYEALIFTSGAISSGLFYDFVKHVFREAVGLEDLANPPRRSVQDRIEPTLGELPAVLESSLIDVHRPIKKDPDITLTVRRPRGEPLAKFDSSTEMYLRPTTLVVPDPIIGNVTRYNAPSRWGRLYDRAEGRIVSFFLTPEVSERGRSLVTWSLHETNMNRENAIYLRAEAIVSANDVVKRYNVSAVSDQPFS